MRVRLLGGFAVEGLTDRDLGSRKARTLLKVLALRHGTPVSADAIAEVLWADEQPAKPSEQVSVLVSRLRAVLGADRIKRTDGGYVLTVEWVDADELATLAAAAAAALQEGRLGVARAAADAALELARGSLLGDEEGEWVEAARAASTAAITAARRVAIAAAAAAGDHTSAIAVAEQALAADPYDEVVLRSLMSSHLAVRRPAGALAAYARARERLAEDLGVPPTAETEALHSSALAAADGDSVEAIAGAVAAVAHPAIGDVVSRDRELAQLDEARRRAEKGESPIVLVEGDPGMGKTVLLDAWLASMPADVLVLRGRCDELGRDLPLQPIADALADHLRTMPAEVAHDRLGQDAETLAPLLGPLSGAAATAVTDAEQGLLRVFAALVAAIERCAGSNVVVLAIEDLQLASATTISWIAFAARRTRRTAFVVTARSRPPLSVPVTTHVTLAPFDRAAIATLVGDEQADELLDRTGGHPLLVDAFRTAPAGGTVPTSVRDAVAGQLASLGQESLRITQVAAVLGRECDLDLIADVSGSTAVTVVAALEPAIGSGLMIERGPRLAFRHELIREAVTATLRGAHIALIHRDAARALNIRPSSDPLAVAVHAREGGDDTLAAPAFVAAAEAAAARFDVDAAEAHLAASLAACPTADAYVMRARVRMSRAAYDDAARDAAEALTLGGGAAALEVAGWVAYYRRKYGEAQAYADEAIEQASPDDPLRVSALALSGRVRHGAGDLSGAVEQLASVGEAPLAVRGVADVWLAHARLHQGRPAEALAALRRPLVDPDSLAHPWAPLHLRFGHAIALGHLGRAAEALAVIDELHAVVAREGQVGARFVAPTANVHSWLLRWTGRGEPADEHNLAAIEATGDANGPSAEGFAEGHYVALLDLADGCLLRDDGGGVEALMPRLRAIDTWTGTMSWHQRHRLALVRGRLALLGGDRDRASALAASVADDAGARGASRYELLALALGALADPSVPEAQIALVIDGLGRCAALDGWPVVAALGRARGVDQWIDTARRRAMVVIDGAGGHDDVRALVDRTLSR